MSAWKKPSRMRVACRNDLDHVERRAPGRSKPWPLRRRRIGRAAMPSIHSRVSTSLARSGPNRPSGRGNRDLRLCDVLGHFRDRRRLEPEIHLHAAPMRASVSTDLDRAAAGALRRDSARPCAPRNRSLSRSRSKRRSMPGRRILTATACAPSVRLHARLVHLRDGGGGDGGAEAG